MFKAYLYELVAMLTAAFFVAVLLGWAAYLMH